VLSLGYKSQRRNHHKGAETLEGERDRKRERTGRIKKLRET
jgi:hypothetical protein